MTRSQVFSDLEFKFEQWLNGLKHNKFSAAHHYVENLKAIGESVTPHKKPTAKWNGFYELLTGKHPSVGIFQVTSIEDFCREYGGAVTFFTAESDEKDHIRKFYSASSCFDDLWTYAFQHGNSKNRKLGDGGHTRNSFVKYCQFLCELESKVHFDDTSDSSRIDIDPRIIREKFVMWLKKMPSSRTKSGFFDETAAEGYAKALETWMSMPPFSGIYPKNLFEVVSVTLFSKLRNDILSVPGYDAFNKSHSSQRLGAALGKYEKFLSELRLPSSGVKIDGPLQQIFYGAPGTGKSKTVNDTAGEMPEENVIRTTFHPDSDYSTFVGAYKPKMEDVPRSRIDGDEIKKITKGDPDFLTEKKISYEFVPQAFAKAYVQAWKVWSKGVQTVEMVPTANPIGVDKAVKDAVEALVAEHGSTGFELTPADLYNKVKAMSGDTYSRGSVLISDYCYNRICKGLSNDKPTFFEYVSDGKYRCLGAGYKYNGPVFQRPLGSTSDEEIGKCVDGIRKIGVIAPVMLVVEEINRGDCAKIFGDLFQLLDRRVKDDDKDPKKKAGFSEYPVLADSDLADYVRGELKDYKASVEADYPTVVADNNLELILPPNMYIWATMNTSDQSLFPMDSAFKRRWDWKYVPIKNHPDKKWKIVIGSNEYSWWTFLEVVNKEILHLTSSEDKQLGFFFVNPVDGIITADTFVNKVLFFLWNGVLKDCYTDCDWLKNGDDHYTFRDFFTNDGEANVDKLNNVMAELFKKAPKGEAKAEEDGSSKPAEGTAAAAQGE